MEARAFASTPFTGSWMQASAVGSAYGAKHPLYGPDVLRWVAKHFPAHLDFFPTNFASAFPVPDSHFTSSLVTPAGCANADETARHNPAPIAAARTCPLMA